MCVTQGSGFEAEKKQFKTKEVSKMYWFPNPIVYKMVTNLVQTSQGRLCDDFLKVFT